MSKITSGELDTLRTYPHASRVYLGVQQGVTLLTAQIDGDHTRGDTTLLLKNVVCADTSDLIRGMTVSLGALETRNRKVSAAYISYNAGTQILTVSPNAIAATDDMYVTVHSAFHLWKLDAPTWDGSQHIKPFAIMGPPRAGFINEPLSFVGEYAYSPVGRTISTYHWRTFDATVESGDVDAANTGADPLVLSWDTAGEYLVKLRVVDDASEAGISFRPVLMYERTGTNAPYQDFVIKNARSSGSGWSADFTVYGDAAEEDFPPEALIVVWAEDFYNGSATAQSIGGAYAGASEIVFAGWIRGGTVKANADDRSVRFTVDSLDAIMARLTMPSFTFRDGDDATDWTHFSGLTIDKAALHLIQQRTTLSLMADVFLALFGFEVGILDVPQGKLLDQLKTSIAGAVFGVVNGSRFASATIARDKNMLTEAQRAYYNTASVSFTSRDWLDLTIETETFAGLARVRLEGKKSDGTLIAAYYPPTGEAHQGDTLTLSGLLFETQDQADELAFRRYRKGNIRIKNVTLRLPNYRVLEPAFQEYFTVVLTADENARALDWTLSLNGDTGREFLCTGMTLEFGDGGISATVTGVASTFGAYAADWTMLDPAPTLQYVAGYGQNAAGDVTAGTLTDDNDATLTDDSYAVLMED